MTLLPWKRTTRRIDSATAEFESLALPLLPSLFNVASWLTQNTDDAEDLVQESFLKALRGFETFERGTNFKAWIFRILRNTFLTSRSGLRAQRTVSLEDELEESNESGQVHYPEGAIDRWTPELNLIRMGDREMLQSGMKQLPASLLEVILLCDVEEMKYKDIALILDLPIGTVMSRISRARTALRRAIETQQTSPRRFVRD